jgi:hypothetical protein
MQSSAEMTGPAIQASNNTYDLKGETGEAGWLAPHVYSEPGAIWASSMGSFNGFEWIETPRAPVFADAGSSTTLTDV